MKFRVLTLMRAFPALLLAACALGPDFSAPHAPDIKSYTAEKPPKAADLPVSAAFGEKMPEKWWTLYRSPELTDIIRAAIKDSPNLAAARATLRAAQEDFTAQGGTIRYPQVNASLQSDRRKVSGVTFGQGGGFIYTLHNASVDVSFMLDPFGAGRRYLESVRAQVDYQGYQLEAAYLSLTANIVTTAISEASLRAQIEAIREIAAREEAQLDIIRKQFELGVVTEAEVLAQQSTLAETRTRIPPLDKQLAQMRHRLSVLVGRFPGQGGMPAFRLEHIRLPRSLPLSLPSELVRQRPDIRAAEAQLHQASALVGLATANLYPSLTITAGYGRQAVKFTDLLNGPASGVWNIGGNILQPLFHGGELTAKRRQALASFDAARAQYRQTVLTAFQNVADVLRALESDGRELRLQQKAESLARRTLALVQQQFKLGAASYLSLLDAEQRYRNSHIGVVQARALLLADSAALFQSMGGGWWRRGDAYQSVARDASFTHFWKSANQPEAEHD